MSRTQLLPDLALCDGRDDWFALEPEEGRRVEAIVEYEIGDPPGAALVLELYDEAGLASSDTSLAGRLRVVGAGLLRVRSAVQGRRTAYQLDVRIAE